MKTILRLLVCMMMIFSSINLFGQAGKEILLHAYEKSKKITSGYYEMSTKMKYMTDADTSEKISKCYFQKVPSDKIFGFKFYQPYIDSTGFLTHQIMYTGKALVRINYKDSTGIITSSDKWSKHLSDIKHNYDFFEPLVSPDSKTTKDFFRPNKNSKIELRGMQDIHSIPCQHIIVRDMKVSNKKEPIQILRIEHSYWISPEDSLVRKYSKAIDVYMNGDTMAQYEELSLNDLRLDNSKDSPGIDIIPDYIKLAPYTPYKREPLLEVSTLAPSWVLHSLKGDSVRLDDLKGRLVLLDFFYKSCYPCMQALPFLQTMHEKYNASGLSVVGIDPFDKDADDLSTFLAKRGVTYTILLAEKNFPKEYKVYSYPTLYLLDENGFILHTQTGYGAETEKDFEKIIIKYLN